MSFIIYDCSRVRSMYNAQYLLNVQRVPSWIENPHSDNPWFSCSRREKTQQDLLDAFWCTVITTPVLNFQRLEKNVFKKLHTIIVPASWYSRRNSWSDESLTPAMVACQEMPFSKSKIQDTMLCFNIEIVRYAVAWTTYWKAKGEWNSRCTIVVDIASEGFSHPARLRSHCRHCAQSHAGLYFNRPWVKISNLCESIHCKVNFSS